MTSSLTGKLISPPPNNSSENGINHFRQAIKLHNSDLAIWVDRIVTSDSEENKSYVSLADFYRSCNKVKKKNLIILYLEQSSLSNTKYGQFYFTKTY